MSDPGLTLGQRTAMRARHLAVLLRDVARYGAAGGRWWFLPLVVLVLLFAAVVTTTSSAVPVAVYTLF